MRKLSVLLAIAVPFVAALLYCGLDEHGGAVCHHARRVLLEIDSKFLPLSSIGGPAATHAGEEVANAPPVTPQPPSLVRPSHPEPPASPDDDSSTSGAHSGEEMAVVMDAMGAAASSVPPPTPGPPSPPALADLEENLRAAAGLYADAEHASARAASAVTDALPLDRDVLVVTCDVGYRQFFHNWLCHLRHVAHAAREPARAWPNDNRPQRCRAFAAQPLFKFVVFAQDEAMAEHVRTALPDGLFGATAFAYHTPALRHGAGNEGGVAGFGNGKFNRVSHMKTEAVLHALRLGYNVLLSDLDVVMLRDPVPHLRRDADVECQQNGQATNPLEQRWAMDPLNTGFCYYRSSPATLRFLEDVIAYQHAHARDDDQACLFLTLLDWTIGDRARVLGPSDEAVPSTHDGRPVLLVRTLHPLLFPTGNLFFSQVVAQDWTAKFREASETAGVQCPVAIHPNYLTGGSKAVAMREKGLWYRRPGKSQDRVPFQCACPGS